MNTETIVIDAKWFYQNKNGDDFTLNPNDFTRNLSGGIFENIKLKAKVRIYTLLDLEGGLYVTSDSFYLSGANFNDSINIGDICLFASSSSNDNLKIEVTAVNSDTIYYNLLENNGFTIPFTTGDPDQLYVITPLTYLDYKWGLRPNNSTENFYRSYLDDDTLSYKVKNIGLESGGVRDTNFKDGEKTAINSNFGNFKARFIENTLSPVNQDSNDLIAQNFEIEHVFKIQDYKESDIVNYINQVRTDNYLGSITLDYNAQFEFRTVETNPETAKIGNYVSEGNVGFFGENFNGRPNVYSISNLEITRLSSGENLDNIPSSEASKITLTINSSENSFNQDPNLVFTHFAMITNYQNKNIDFSTLFYNDDVRVSGVSAENSTIINEAKILSFTSNSIDVELVINPNDGTLEDHKYFISVLVSDPEQNNLESNKVPLVITTGTYENGFDIEGLIGQPVHDLFLRDCTDYSMQGATSFAMIKAELIMTKIVVPVLDGEIVYINLQTIATKKDGNNQVVAIYEIDSESLDIEDFVTVNGIQEINKVLPNNNQAQISEGSIKHLGNKEYEIIYPFRMPYDNTRPVDNLPDDLFDNTLPNNGKSEDVYYIQEKGLDLHIAYQIGMLKDGIVTNYRYRTKKILIKDFETNLG